MDKSLFQSRITEAVQLAREFAGQFFLEDLPPAIRCRVKLGSSYDGNPLHEDEVVFPDDYSPELRARASQLSIAETCELLWRDERVPEWVDVSAIARTADHTVVEMSVCGRFTANDALLYHEREKRPPFHVVGPALPYGYQEGQKFSIYRDASCYALDEYESLREHLEIPRMLTLSGPNFDDAFLAEIDPLPGLEVLQISDAPIVGPGFRGLANLPRLKWIRGYLAAPQLDLSDWPSTPALDGLLLSGLGQQPDALAVLAQQASELTELQLRMHELNQPLVLPALPKFDRCEIFAERITSTGAVNFSALAQVTSLSLHGAFGDDAICRAIDQLPNIHSLSLCDSAAGEATVAKILATPRIHYADLMRTQVPSERVAELRAQLNARPRA